MKLDSVLFCTGLGSNLNQINVSCWLSSNPQEIFHFFFFLPEKSINQKKPFVIYFYAHTHATEKDEESPLSNCILLANLL